MVFVKFMLMSVYEAATSNELLWETIGRVWNTEHDGLIGCVIGLLPFVIVMNTISTINPFE